MGGMPHRLILSGTLTTLMEKYHMLQRIEGSFGGRIS
jgi:hypothetical protein